MSSSRLAFDRPSPSCVACGVDLPADPPPGTTRLAVVDPPVDLVLCAPCRVRIDSDGPPPATFAPEFQAARTLRLPLATALDLRAFLDAVVSVAPGRTADAERAALLARSDEPSVADYEAWVARVRGATGRPDPVDVAGMLTAGARLGLEPEPSAAVRRVVDRANGPDELGICFGAYCARLAGEMRWHTAAPPPSARAVQLLAEADRTLLLATLPPEHGLASRAAQVRAGALIALGRAKSADAQLDQAGQDDPRTHLLRGLRFAQQGNAAAADRAFRAASDSPFAGRDVEVAAASVWNRATRALEATRLPEARDALRAVCRLAPGDREARLLLGHTYVRLARDHVAREVLGSVLDDQAVAHLRSLAEEDAADVAARSEGRLLYASCLWRLGEPRAARSALEAELDVAGAPRRAEVLRLAARCDLELGAEADALRRLGLAAALDGSVALAREVAWSFGHAARTQLELHGLPGLFGLLEQHPWVPGVLRRRYGATHAFLLVSLALQQILTDYRPQAGFGLDWSFLGARAANGVTAQYQACASAMLHQFAAALRHDLAAQAAGGAPLPWASLAALWSATRRAQPDEREQLIRLLASLAERLRAELA